MTEAVCKGSWMLGSAIRSELEEHGQLMSRPFVAATAIRACLQMEAKK